MNWSEHGVQASSMVDSWKIEDLVLPSDGRSAIASDGQWLYVHCAAGLLKLGSGYGGTRKVCVVHQLFLLYQLIPISLLLISIIFVLSQGMKQVCLCVFVGICVSGRQRILSQ